MITDVTTGIWQRRHRSHMYCSRDVTAIASWLEKETTFLFCGFGRLKRNSREALIIYLLRLSSSVHAHYILGNDKNRGLNAFQGAL